MPPARGTVVASTTHPAACPAPAPGPSGHLRRCRKTARSRQPRALLPHRLEAIANRSPSSSVSTPAACAAASSPSPCPTTTLGAIPTLAHSAVSAHSQRIDRRLHPHRIVQVARRSRAPEQHIQQRHAPLFPDYCIAPVQDCPHYRLTLIQRLPHTDPLAAVPGVGERHRRRRLWPAALPLPRRGQSVPVP